MTQDHLPDAGKMVGQDCEPFGYFRVEPFGWTNCAPDDEGAIPLYAAPPKREPLSDEQIEKLVDLWFCSAAAHGTDFNARMKAVLAELGNVEQP
jgi:hypothetical protein